MHTCVHAPHTGGGGGNTIPSNWKEIYRGYKLSATCIQHSKCTVHRVRVRVSKNPYKKNWVTQFKNVLYYLYNTDYKTGFKMTTRKGVTNWGEFLARKIW